MSAEGQSRTWMLAVVVSTALLLAVAAGAAIGSLMAQRSAGVVPVVDRGGSAARLSAVVAQPAEAATDESEEPAGDPVAINSVGGDDAEAEDSEPVAEDEEQGSSPAAESKTGERMEPKVDLSEMRDKLSPEQYAVCFNAATEPPFTGKYWDHHEPGAYHCVACDTALFASNHKFDSGTGWPSFYEAVDRGSIATHEDRSHGMLRTEVLCANCGAHLGHLFQDGPAPTGLRYCINSAALEFREDEAQQ